MDFVPDVIDQQEDDPTIGNLADVLWQSTVWYFLVGLIRRKLYDKYK